MGQDLTIVAEYYDGRWQLAEPMVPTGVNDELPDYLSRIPGYLEQYGHLLPRSREPTHRPVDLWNHRNTTLQNQLREATKHHGLPDDCSAELREYVETYCSGDWVYGLGWAHERELSPEIKQRIRLSRYRALGQLRVVYWFS